MRKALLIVSSFLLALVTLAPLSVAAQAPPFNPNPSPGPSTSTAGAYCFDDSINKTYMGTVVNGAADCTNGGTPGNRIPALVDEPFYAICYNLSASSYILIPQDDPAGKYTCPATASTMKTCPSFGGPSNMCLAKPTTQTNTNTSNTNTRVPTNTGGGTTTGGGSTSSSPCDPPEAGFHLVGGLCVPKSPFDNGNSFASSRSLSDLAVKVIRFLLYFAGMVAVIMIIVGGYLYMTARGDATQAANGRKTLVNALIGLAITILAYIIVQAVVNFITK
jgi:hypothetical protein